MTFCPSTRVSENANDLGIQAIAKEVTMHKAEMTTNEINRHFRSIS
jgi:hypothetical protein